MTLKDVFGKPGEGMHKYRIFGFAVVDIIATIVIAFVIFWIFMKHSIFNFIFILTLLFILGELLHYMLGVRTEFIKRYIG